MAVERHAAIHAIAQEWDELADRVQATPWERPGWFAPWWAAFGAGALEVVVLRRDGRLAAVVPLVRRRGALYSPTNWHTPQFALLAEDATAAREVAEAIFDRRPRRVQLAFIDRTGGLDEAIEAARGARYRVLVRTLERSPYVPVRGAWDDYVASLGKRTKDMRRRRRRLEEEGTLALDVQDGSERFDELLEEGFRIEASGWKEEQGTAIRSRPETLAMYTAICRWARSRGWLRLKFLRLDGRAIAFQLNVEADGVCYDVKGGYDEEFAKFGPGLMITFEILRDLWERGVRSYEFLGSEEPFKAEFTDLVRERMLVQAFAPGPVAAADWAAFAWGRPLAKKALALPRR